MNILSPSISNCSTVPIRSTLEAVPSAGPGLASQVQYILRFQYTKVSTSKVKSQQTFLSSSSALRTCGASRNRDYCFFVLFAEFFCHLAIFFDEFDKIFDQNFDFLVDFSLTYCLLTVASFRIGVPSILFNVVYGGFLPLGLTVRGRRRQPAHPPKSAKKFPFMQGVVHK